MGNVLLAIQAATALLAELTQINSMIQAAQAAGVDITSDQLATIINGYNTAIAKLNADIQSAAAAGK